MVLGWQRSRRDMLLSCVAPATFAGLTLAIFHTVLFQRGTRVPCSPDDDLILQFLPWRDFGFGQIKHGNFPLWNPYIFGGTPYFAGFQSALLYPANWLHLILPLTTAINWIIALQVFCAGYFTYLWCRGRGTSIGAGILAGIMFMFSGQYFLHIFAGHLPHLCVMAWAPLLFLVIDKLSDTGAWQWCLLGMIAVAMQILGGHPQYLFYTGIISFLYAALGTIRSKHRLALAGGYIIIFVGACTLTAVQLLAGLQAAGESVRSGGTDFAFASMFALPPENLFTFIAPGFLGKLPMLGDATTALQYFGRCYLWEMSVFVSITGLVLFFFGAVATWRKNWCLIVMIFVTIALALGKHLPLYRPLFDYVPEYGTFRSVSKFSYLMCLFICVLAATGFDVVLTQRKAINIGIALTAIAGVGLLILSFCLQPSASGSGTSMWENLILMIAQSNESYLPPLHYSDHAFIQDSAKHAAAAVGWAAATMAAVFVLLIAARRKSVLAYALIVLATAEMLVFANTNMTSTQPESNYPPEWSNTIRDTPGDYRVVNSAIANGLEIEFLDQGMSMGIRNLWGYDPGVLKRYAQTLAASQGQNPDQANQYLQISRGTLGLFQMLRCRFALQWPGNTPNVMEITSPLPVAQLVSNWVVRDSRDAVLSIINSGSFDPRKLVVLESQPGIEQTDAGVNGPAEVVDSSTDWVEIRTTTPAPTLLLITNNYSTGWRVVPMEPSIQTHYEILPANHTLMAIPLQAGSHHFRVEYLPTAYVVGKWISIAALVAYGSICVVWGIRRFSPRKQPLLSPLAEISKI